MNSLVEHWRGLTGTIHPLDAEAFACNPHSFNLEYPPPAFLGDVVNAPAVLLNLNGGYDPVVTPSEFGSPNAVERYLEMLHEPAPVDPAIVAPYYAKANYADLIRDGKLVMVNAVAYRSRKMSEEPENYALAQMLRSTTVHRKWLRDHLLPAAKKGERLVVAHRWSLWNLDKNRDQQPGLVFSNSPASPNLSKAELATIYKFCG